MSEKPARVHRAGALLAPPILPAYLGSAARILRRRVFGPRRFRGDAVAICRAIVDSCWTGDYLAASAGHFRQLWTRDLAFSAPSLVRLGQADRVEASLVWALEAWSRRGRVTTTIFGGGRPADVYTVGCDSLPLLLLTLETGGFADLFDRHASWLRMEVERYAATVVDPRTALVRTDLVLSSHRDTVRTPSSCYANTMLVVLDQVGRRTGWYASPVDASIGERMVEAFWRGDHFSDRADRDLLTGDAGVFPFWTGTVSDRLGLASALAALRAAGLTSPLPLRYAMRRDARAEDPVQRLFVPDYQGTSVWSSLGAIYLSLLARVEPSESQAGLTAYARLIERDGTLREVYTGDLRPYRGRLGLFLADEAMLWASILLATMTELGRDRTTVEGLRH